MTAFELTMLAYEAAHLIDNTFETWMAATFAIIVVAHAAGDRLNLTVKLFIAVLYLACSLLLYIRYEDFVRVVFEHISQASAMERTTVTPAKIKGVGIFRRFVFIIGTIGAVAFLCFPGLMKLKSRGKPMPTKSCMDSSHK